MASPTTQLASSSSLVIQTHASIGSTYIPPLAGSSISGIGIIPTASATISYNNPNPTTPAFTNDYDWINTYLAIHKMSPATYRYAYLLWFVIVLAIVIAAILHLTGGRGGVTGARWSKWALRRRTWRKKSTLAAIRKSNRPHRQPWSLPSNAQIVSLVAMFIIPCILCTVGPDYISPITHLWDFTHNLTKRHFPEELASNKIDFNLFRRTGIVTVANSPPQFTIQKEWWTAGGRTGIIAFSLFPLVILLALKMPPFAILAIPFTIQIHFDKLARLHSWLGRLIWFITAVHVVTWGVQLGQDKRHGRTDRAWNYVWVYDKFIFGLIGFVCMTLLTLLSFDPLRKRHYELFYISHVTLVPLTMVFSALHFPPLWWWVWTPLFLWVLERSYRMGRFLYINGILGNAATKKPASALVYSEDDNVEKPLVSTTTATPEYRPPFASTRGSKQEMWEMDIRYGKNSDGQVPTPRNPRDTVATDARDSTGSVTGSIVSLYDDGQTSAKFRASLKSRNADAHGNFRDSGATDETAAGEWSPGTMVDTPLTRQSHAVLPKGAAPPQKAAPHLVFPTMHPLPSILSAPSLQLARLPPPGYAKAILLPGYTIRLSLITARRFTWAPGQHVLLTIPEISRFQSHPFTIASVSDAAIAGPHGREMILVVRAKKGFTRKLWDEVKRRSTEKRTSFDGKPKKVQPGYFDPETAVTGHGAGVLFRAYVDGPFGSSERAHLGSHSSVVIVCGGSGVSFGTALLEYLTLCLCGRDGRSLGGRSGGVGKNSFITRRVRFIWLVREYSHLQWVSPIIRRCVDMIPNMNVLQVDIYVTNFADTSKGAAGTFTSKSADNMHTGVDDPLAPPAPRFARESQPKRRLSISSDHSDDSAASSNSLAELNYADGGRDGDPKTPIGDGSDDGHVLDLTNFDGDDDTHMTGEAQFSLKLRKEGRLRRAKSRRVTTAIQAKRELDQKAAASQHLANQQPRGPPYDDSFPRDLPTVRSVPPSASRSPLSPTKVGGWDQSGVLLPSYQQGVSMTDIPLSPTYDSDAHPPLAPQPQRWGDATPRSGVTPRPGEEYLPPTSPPISTYGQHGRSYSDNRLSAPLSLVDRGPSPSPSGHFEGGYDSRTLGGAESMKHLMPHHTPGLEAGPSTSLIHVADDVQWDFDEDELDDLHVVSAMARPGRPRLDKILGDEVERSKGPIAVACCGPTSLNVMTRKYVTALISPQRLQRGDRRGQITLISEEFEW